MQLVVIDEVETESRRIIACSDTFAVLKLQPSSCSVDDVKRAHEVISAVLRRREAIRSPLAITARGLLDQAKAKLLDPLVFQREKMKYMSAVAMSRKELRVFEAMITRTDDLERQAMMALHMNPTLAAEVAQFAPKSFRVSNADVSA